MPFGGRRLLAFTDSRQGTARIAARLQQESERNYVRSLLYHRLAQLGGQRDEQRITQIRDEIAALEGPAQANGMLRSMLEGKRNELQSALTAGPGRLPWGDALNYLLAQQGFTQLAIPPLEELTLGQLSERELAALCLWREFMFRPRRQFSLEGLGLACLEYQGLARVSEAPAVLRHHGANVDEWRDLLRIVLDVQVRGWMAVNIPRDTLRWTGYPGLPRVIVPPGRDKVSRNQQAWPNLQTSMGLRSRLVRLIAYSLRLNPEDLGDRDQIEEILLEIWGALKKVLSVGEDGYCYLDLPKQVELSGVKIAWFCPVTRRLLPAVFRGITPYLPADSSEDLARCVPVEMPALPEPFWNGDRKAAEAWLETDERVAELRHIGAWSDINDRIATFADYFRAVEHSAQIDGSLLTRREKAFKEGRINLLSCSTTMEMGVDIGGLAAVAMNNVPPHPANFLQRAGRAGRRGETRALSFTLCKSDPQGEAVFANPLWAFTTPLALPGVSMQSRRIVQRHVNSLLLTRFLGQYTDQEAFRLNCGWFFLIPDEQRRSSPAHQFQAWCRRDALNEGLEESMKSMVHGSSLAGVQTQQLLEEAALAAERIEAAWAEEHEALQTNLAEVRTPAGNSKPETAIRLQMQRLEDEYLLSELATRGFLPGYGFPTGVVSLLTTTMSTLKRGLRQREDNRAITRGVPSRPIWQALRDYAPGTDTTLDGRVYRSAGVTLNWHLPVHLEAGQEIQGFSWVWGCNRCGGTGTRAYRPEQCPHCGEADGEKLVRREFLQPAGFAVDIRSRPHNNVNLQQYLPVCDPLISVQGASWMALPDPALGRYRHSADGHIFHRSEGLHGRGYTLCLRCGRADSTSADELSPPSMEQHKRLRGGRDNDREQYCPGNDEGAVKDGLLLGASLYTDVFELQLHDSESGESATRVQAYSIGVVLRRALCRWIGIEEEEIGIHSARARGSVGDRVYSIYLFDTAAGGAGYVAQLARQLDRLLGDAANLLQCHCDKACQSCLLMHDTQYHAELLDRKAALDLMGRRFLDALKLPQALQVFGEKSRLELEPLDLALQRESQHQNIDEIRFHLCGDPTAWEPLLWLDRFDLPGLHRAGTRLTFVAPGATVDGLSESQAAELAAVLSVTEGILWKVAAPSLVDGGLSLILEAGGPRATIRWAATEETAGTPAVYWGSGAEDARFVIGQFAETLPERIEGAVQVTAEELRKPPAGLTEIVILGDLNGPARTFGDRAWKLIVAHDAFIREKADQKIKISRILYSDRYLLSPLSILLAHALLHGVATGAGVLENGAEVRIVTESITLQDPRRPFRLFHNWHDGQTRRTVFYRLFGGFGGFSLDEREKMRVPHARTLSVQWLDGTEWMLRMDQGVGYWRLGKGEKGSFPFDQDGDVQARFLQKAGLRVMGQSDHFPTYWYSGPRTTS